MSGATLLNISEELKDLNGVKEKITCLKFNELVRHVPEEKLAVLDENEKNFVSKWRKFEDITTDVCTYTLPNQEELRYLVRDAYVETSRRKKNMFDENSELLPKEQRTIVEIIQTVFIEKDEQVYAVLMTSNSTSINKIKRLFGDYLQEIEEEDEPDINNYKIDPDLFYWLFYKHEEHNRLIEPRFEVVSIAGFIGNIADETHTVTGNSDNTPSLLVTKAFVSKYHPFKSLDVILKYDNYKLDFIFNDKSECYLRSSSSIPNLRIDKKIATTLIIYGFIIPHLSKLFSEDSVWSIEQTRHDFAKKIGKEVIKEIADFHDISLGDILN